MQIESKHIYKELADETGKSEQLFKDLGNFVWSETYHTIRHPKSLIIKLKGIGAWNLRRKRMQILVEDFPLINTDKIREDFRTDREWERWCWRRDLRINFTERLKDYEEFIRIRDDIRKQRRT